MTKEKFSVFSSQFSERQETKDKFSVAIVSFHCSLFIVHCSLKKIKTLCFACFLLTATMAAQAQFSGGAGTSGSPYIIVTAADLDNVRNYLSAYFELANDIDLTTYLASGGAGHNSGAGWSPIGDASTPTATFRGSFDGAGHKITGLWINRSGTDNVGLFGRTFNNASIVNLSVETAATGIVGKDYVGGLVGYNNNSTITNCHINGDVTGATQTGGLIGVCQNSTVENCHAEGTVTGTAALGRIGGLVGVVSTTSNIKYCYADVNVTGNSNTGGLTGYNDNATIENCYAVGNVSGNTQVGGLVGSNTFNSKIENCYATGNVSGSGTFGGLVGSNNSSTLTNCFFDYQTTGRPSSYGVGSTINAAGVTGKNTADMQLQTTFTTPANWDFTAGTGVWGICPNTYPFLQWQGNSCTPTISITTSPSNATVTYGSITGSLSVAATVTQSAALSYQWYSNATNVVPTTGGTPISSANGASFNIPTNLAAGTYYYFCEVSATGGATSKRSAAATVTVNPRGITVTANAGQTKVYGASDPTFTYTCTPALISGDSFAGALSRATGENVGSSYAISQGTLNAGSNYTITFNSANFAITAKAITVTANTGQTKVYGASDPTFTCTVSPTLQSGDSFTGALTRVAGENVGSYAISQGTLSAGSNYTITFTGNNFSITAKAITVTANGGSSTYGDSPTNPGISATGLENGETVSVLTGLYNDFAITASTTVGSYTLNVTGTLTNNNYTVTTNTGTWTVNKANPTYTPLTGLIATYGDLLSSLTLPAGWTWDTPTNSVGNAGTQTHAATFTPADITNYNILTGISLTVTVSRVKVAKPALTQATFTYSGAPHTVTLNPVSAFYTLSGGNITETAAGNYAATVTLTDANNYEWTDGTATPLSLSWTITAPPLPVYTVTLNQSTGGTATVSHTSATAGASVTLTATPAGANYSLVRWDISPANVTWTSGSATTPSATFTMPAGSVTVTPVFQYSPSPPPIPPQYARRITVEQTIGGTLTADKQYAATRDTVTLTITPDTGYTLEEIIIYQTGTTTPTDVEIQGTGNTRTFFMPAYDVTVTAHFAFGEVANEQLTMNNEQWGAWTHDGVLYISGLTQGKPLHIYNIFGQLVYQATVVSDKAAIPLPARGLYIIQTNNQTLKTVY